MAHHSPVPEIPGIKAEHGLAQTLRREVAVMLGRGNNISFPGAQPVSFATKHLEELKRTDYYLCEKSDGVRCLMYFTRDGDKEVHYLIDRKNDYYWVQNLHFPKPNDDSFQSFHTDTLIDGELVLDDIGDGKRMLRYLVFDCLLLDNKPLMKRMLDKRLGYFMVHVFQPYTKLCETYPAEVPFFPFQIKFKRMEFSYSIPHMFDNILPKLPHGNDGLIFTCRTTPYKFGTDEHIIKWKPASENSIDFRLNLEFPPIPHTDLEEDEYESDAESDILDFNAMPVFNLSVFMGDDRYEKWAKMYVTPEQWEELKGMGQPLEDTIVECAMDEQKRWRYMRFRNDKKHGNHISTVNSVMESVKDAVSKENLIAAHADIRGAWKKRAAAVAAAAAKGPVEGPVQQKKRAATEDPVESPAQKKRAVENPTEGPMHKKQAVESLAEGPIHKKQAVESPAEDPVQKKRAASGDPAESPMQKKRAASGDPAESPMHKKQTVESPVEGPMHSKQAVESLVEDPVQKKRAASGDPVKSPMHSKQAVERSPTEDPVQNKRAAPEDPAEGPMESPMQKKVQR